VRIYNRALTQSEVINDSMTAVSTSSPPQFIVGDKNIESTVQYTPAGVAQMFQFTPIQGGKFATNIRVYLDADSVATRLDVGIYSSAADGHPLAKLTGGTSTALKAGAWNSVSIGSQSLAAGYHYWIGILGSGGSLQLRGQPGAGLMETSVSNTLTSLPNPWPTDSTSSIYGLASIYAVGF